jgi:hypothetical protein
MSITDALLHTWAAQREYAARLLADLSQEDMTRQPIPGITMNHGAWTIGHISAYPPVLAAILRERPFADPKDHRYGRDSKPSSNPRDYPPKEVMAKEFFGGHDDLAAALAGAGSGVLGKPIPLARWQQRFPIIADAVIHLMLHHESAHLGQLSAWRRACGKPAV